MAGFIPSITQGSLNRVRTHIVVASYPQLSVTAPYMSKSQAVLTFDGPGVDQIDTATGVVNSPRPFVMGQIVISLLRTQTLGNDWLAQWQTQAVIGTVLAFSDASTLDTVTLINTSIIDVDPGAFDGADPTMKVTLKGVYYINSDLWAMQ